MTVDKKEVLDGLKNMFQDILPDEEYLEDDEDLQEEINDIQQMIDNDTTPIESQISTLSRFNNEWFPDGLDEEEQAEFRELLDAAYSLVKEEN